MLTPASRSGVVANFALMQGSSGEIVLLDKGGAPLATGSIVTRRSDGVRFVVGDQGKTFLEASTTDAFDGAHCSVLVSPEDIAAGEPLMCRG